MPAVVAAAVTQNPGSAEAVSGYVNHGEAAQCRPIGGYVPATNLLAEIKSSDSIPRMRLPRSSSRLVVLRFLPHDGVIPTKAPSVLRAQLQPAHRTA